MNNKPNEAEEKFTPNSSFLELVQYEPSTLTMTITFKTGSQHKYLYVFPTVYQSFKSAASHGTYYSKLIKGKLTGVPIQKHDVSTKHKVNPFNKQPRSQTYGSRSIYPGTGSKEPGKQRDKPATRSSKPSAGNTPNAFGLQG